MNKRAELHREYARVIEMCEGTDVQPWWCVRCNGEPLTAGITFCGEPDSYTFALGIVEGEPVFKGDEVYIRTARETRKRVAKSDGWYSESGVLCSTFGSEKANGYTWTPPF